MRQKINKLLVVVYACLVSIIIAALSPSVMAQYGLDECAASSIFESGNPVEGEHCFTVEMYESYSTEKCRTFSGPSPRSFHWSGEENPQWIYRVMNNHLALYWSVESQSVDPVILISTGDYKPLQCFDYNEDTTEFINTDADLGNLAGSTIKVWVGSKDSSVYEEELYKGFLNFY